MVSVGWTGGWETGLFSRVERKKRPGTAHKTQKLVTASLREALLNTDQVVAHHSLVRTREKRGGGAKTRAVSSAWLRNL